MVHLPDGRRSLGAGDEFWCGLERRVYFVPFPALLLNALTRTAIDYTSAGPLLSVGVLFTLAGMVLGYGAKLLFQLAPGAFASGVQCAFRFNSSRASRSPDGWMGSRGSRPWLPCRSGYRCWSPRADAAIRGGWFPAGPCLS